MPPVGFEPTISVYVADMDDIKHQAPYQLGHHDQTMNSYKTILRFHKFLYIYLGRYILIAIS